MNFPESFQYVKEFEINSNMVNPRGELRVKGLCDLLQEVAWKHADSEDFGRNLSEANQMWALARLELRWKALPKWGQKIRLYTGGRGVDKLFAFREFLMQDQEGNELVRGMSSWLLLDIESKRMLRPSMVLPQALFDSRLKPDWQPVKILPKGCLIQIDELKVRPSDLDLYNHVNNTSYIRWVEDLIIEAGFQILGISINYLAECRLGDEVKISLSEEGNQLFAGGSVMDKNSFIVQAEVKKIS